MSKSKRGGSIPKMGSSVKRTHEDLMGRLASLESAKAKPKVEVKAKEISSKGGVGEGKFISSGDFGKKQANFVSSQAVTNALSGGDDNGLSQDSLDLFAVQLIELLQTNVFHFSHLTKHEKFIIYRFFQKTNPILGRILDLHTDLPLSKMRFTAPENQPEIVKDYILQFYQKIFDRLKFPELIRDMVLSYWIYGEAYVFVDDYFLDFERELQTLQVLDSKVFEVSGDTQSKLAAVESAYSTNPKSVSAAERKEYIEKKFSGFYSEGYMGPDRAFVIPFYMIEEYFENSDIGFQAINYSLSDELRSLGLQKEGSNAALMELGYTKGFIHLMNESREGLSGGFNRGIVVDNDTTAGVPFIFSMKRPDGSSILSRVFAEALEWDASKRALKAKLELFGKIGRIVTAEDLSEEQVNVLRAEVRQMIDDPSHAVVANFPISWEEVNSFLKDELRELIERSQTLTDEIAMGMGMPSSLISGESSYSGDTIKLEMLNTQYLAFKNVIQDVITNYLLKPIAMRKGFVTLDDWGTPVLLHPTLSFSRMTVRDDSVYDMLLNLYLKGSLPISVLYDILNIDSADVQRAIKEDLWTINDPNTNQVISEVMSAAVEDICQETDVKERIIKGLNLKKVSGGEAGSDFQKQSDAAFRKRVSDAMRIMKKGR